MRKIVAVLLVLLVGTLAGCGAEMQKDGMTASATQKQQEDNRETRQIQRDPGYITSEDELKGQKNHIQKTQEMQGNFYIQKTDPLFPGGHIQKTDPPSPAIIVDEVREVIPGALVVTKTVSAYAHGQHLVQVEGRFKRSEGDLYLALLDDSGRQLGSGGLHRSDQVREIDGEWSYFSHKLVEDTGKIVDIDKGSIVFHLRREGQDKKGLLDIPIKRPQGVVTSPGDKPVKVPPTEEWQVVSRAYRVQGTILKLAMTEDELETIIIEVTKNIELPNNPVVADFTGEILGIVYNQKLSEAGSLRSKLTKGSQIVVTFAQYAVPPEGKVVLGAKFDRTYYEENGKYYDFQGNPYSEIPVLKMKFSVDFGMEADLLVDSLTDKSITYRYFNYQHKSGPDQPRTVPFEEMLKTEEGIRAYKVHMFLADKGNWAELKLSPDFIDQLENSPDFRQRLGLMLNKPFNKELKGMALSPQDITINPPDIVMEVASPTKKVSAFAVKITEYKTDVYLSETV